MKALALAAASTAALFAAPAQAETWNIFSANDEQLFLLDLDSIAGGEAWSGDVSRSELPVEKPIALTHWVFDCGKRRAVIDAMISNDEEGVIIENYDSKSDSMPVNPGSVMEHLMLAVCKGKYDPENTLPEGVSLSEIRETMRPGD